MPIKKNAKSQNAIAMLKEDHTTVKGLFDKFEGVSGAAAKKKIVTQAVAELKVHATLEEELFYPALRQQMDDQDGLLDEADEEHHVAKILIAELEQMQGDEDHWEAKFKVLAESVRHHIKEEEGELFPQAKKTDIDFQMLGERLANRKAALMKGGVPPDFESQMVRQAGLRGESPAKMAQDKLEVPIKAA